MVETIIEFSTQAELGKRGFRVDMTNQVKNGNHAQIWWG